MIHSRLGRGRRVLAGATTAALLTSGAALVTTAGAAAAAPDRTASADARYHKPLSSGRYLVTFAAEPAATYEGGIAGYPRTRPDTGRKLDPTRTEVQRYRQRLTAQHDATLSAVGATKSHDYTVATNGVAVELTAAQARALEARPEVVSLERDAAAQPTTNQSPEFLGLMSGSGAWSAGRADAGRGVIVGIIDTGIWPESPSFAGAQLKRDAAGLPVESTGLRGTWFGDCVQGERFDSQDCNDKLIGARYYLAGFGRHNVARTDYLSPRDSDGHGSHTGSTAAGNVVEDVTVDGTRFGTLSGMAPGARVAAYKVCWEPEPGASGGCFNSDAVAAVDDAVADGVDVLNYSIGSSSESSVLSVVEQAFRRAANVGIFVAASAGNGGPGASTLDHPSPWLTTVAASTFRKALQAVVLGDGQRFVGASVTGPLATATPFVRSLAVKAATATDTDARLCVAGSLDPVKANGKVVQCDRGVIARIEKSFEVRRAGGLGMVMTNTGPSSLNGDLHAVPSVHLSHLARQAVVDYAASPGATARIVPATQAELDAVQVPEVAAFSSRGPSTTTAGDVLKPDVAAPGVDVLAAVAPPRRSGRGYDFLSGTSMSSPHIAGIATLVKAAHRDWGPAEVKSALMTTARDHATVASRDVFAQGAGLVRPDAALDPGLVFPAGPDDWRRYLVGQGVRFAAPYDTLTPISGSELNQPSIAVGSLLGERTVTRTVKNVGTARETYTVHATLPGFDVHGPGSITVDPGETETFSVTLTRGTAPLGHYAKGSLTLTSEAHTVRIPVAVRPVAVTAPAEVTAAPADGSSTWTVTPGFSGALGTSVLGLDAATPQAGVVSTGAFATTPGPANVAYPFRIAAGDLVRLDLDAADDRDDLDLFLYDASGSLVDLSASAAGDERLTLSGLPAGDYTAWVNGYETRGGGAYAFTQWSLDGTPDATLVVDPPGAASVGRPQDVTARWSGLQPGLRYLARVDYTAEGVGADATTYVTLR